MSELLDTTFGVLALGLACGAGYVALRLRRQLVMVLWLGMLACRVRWHRWRHRSHIRRLARLRRAHRRLVERQHGIASGSR